MNEEYYTFACPACRAELSLQTSLAGVTGPCPLCTAEITAPLPPHFLPAGWHAGQTAAGAVPPQYPAYSEESSQQYGEYGQLSPALSGQNVPSTPTAYSLYAEEPAYEAPVRQAPAQLPLPQSQNQAYSREVSYDASYEDTNDGIAEEDPMGNFFHNRVEEQMAQHQFALNAATQQPPPPVYVAPPSKSSKKMLLALAAGGLATIGMAVITLNREPQPATTAFKSYPAATEDEPAISSEPATEKVTSKELAPATTKPATAEMTEVKKPVVDASLPEPETPTPLSKDSARIESNIANLAEQDNVRKPDDSLVAKPLASPPGKEYIQEPRELLEKFLAAKNWKERQQYVLDAKNLTPVMEEYYKENPDGPLKVDSINYLTSAQVETTQNRLTVFEVNCNAGGRGTVGIPVVVEQTLDGNLVDWQSFVEFKDLHLPKFFEKFRSESGNFRVVMERHHYFGTDVPNMDKKIAFTVEPPVDGFENYVWVDQDNTKLLEKLGSRRDFDQRSQPIVKLRWVKDAEGAAYVMLEDVVADNWRGDSSIKKALPKNTAQVPEHEAPNIGKISTSVRP